MSVRGVGHSQSSRGVLPGVVGGEPGGRVPGVGVVTVFGTGLRYGSGTCTVRLGVRP